MASSARAVPSSVPAPWRQFLRYLLRGLAVAILLALLMSLLYWQLSRTYRFHWVIPLQFIPKFNQGLLITLEASAIAAVFALTLGLFVALARLSPFVQLRDLGTLYVHTFRNIPFFVFVLIAYFGLGRAIDVGPLVSAIPSNIDEGLFWGIAALSIFEGAFMAEIIRAGIGSIHPTQMEAARSLGMSFVQAMRYIILPQAFRNIIPALTGELIALVKESSLLFYIAVQELTLTARQLAAHEGATFEFYTLLAAYYLAITLPLAGLSHLLERKLKLKIGGREELT